MTDVTYDTAVYECDGTGDQYRIRRSESSSLGGKRRNRRKIVRDYIYEFGKRTGAGDNSDGKTVIYRNYPVKTGDVAPIAVLAAMSGISAGVLTAVERWKRKKEN